MLALWPCAVSVSMTFQKKKKKRGHIVRNQRKAARQDRKTSAGRVLLGGPRFSMLASRPCAVFRKHDLPSKKKNKPITEPMARQTGRLARQHARLHANLTSRGVTNDQTRKLDAANQFNTTGKRATGYIRHHDSAAEYACPQPTCNGAGQSLSHVFWSVSLRALWWHG